MKIVAVSVKRTTQIYFLHQRPAYTSGSNIFEMNNNQRQRRHQRRRQRRHRRHRQRQRLQNEPQSN